MAEDAPDLVARFAADLARVWPEARDPAARLALAVSGGPDSLALLLLAHRLRPGAVIAATVDHCLRAASADEAAMVASVCAGIGVEHKVLPVAVAPGNLQSAARLARYAALASWMAAAGAGALATAHHADDQAETLLLRLARGSGVAGLAGVRPRARVPGTGPAMAKSLTLVRPLLGWRRAELAAVVAEAGLVAVDDPSNRDEAYDRARLRARLAEADWLPATALAASAAHLADADAALDWAAAREWQECVTAAPGGLTYRPMAPRAVALRVMARIVRELDQTDDGEPAGETSSVRGSALARLFDTLLARQPGSIGNLVARPLPEGWSFTRAPRRRI